MKIRFKTLVLVFASGLFAHSDAATLLLHYELGEDGSINSDNRFVSTVPGEPAYQMTSVYPSGTYPAVSDVSGIPGSSKASSNISQYGANLTELNTELNNSDAGGNGSYMMSFWINTANTTSEQTILYTGNNNFKFYISSGLELAVSKHGSTSRGSGIILTPGDWTNLGIYYDAAAKTYTFSMNGDVIGSPISYGEAATWGTNTHLGLYSGGIRKLDSNTLMDEFKIYRMESGDDFTAMAMNEYRFGNALIPEPATTTLGLAGLALLLGRRKRH